VRPAVLILVDLFIFERRRLKHKFASDRYSTVMTRLRTIPSVLAIPDTMILKVGTDTRYRYRTFTLSELSLWLQLLKRERKLANPIPNCNLYPNHKVISLANILCANTLATELLLLSSTGIHYTMFSIIMHYAEFAHLTAPLVCWFIYYLCL